MSIARHSFGKLSRLGLAAIFAVSAFSGFATNSVSADELTIGSKAPALDIEHWVSDRDGEFKQVTEFEANKVYIIEFWATWCGPCLRSMPHLAELQDKYADKGVQLISVSDEDLSKVEKFLKRKVPGEKEKTYGELTSAYCLTADPDESVYEDYMRAAGQTGIPTAFIVGKDGMIEWIGHPTRMDQPLAQVVEGKWDREKYVHSLEKAAEFESLAKELWDMKEDGDAKGALAELDVFMKDLDKDSEVFANSSTIRTQLVMEIGGPEAVKAFKKITGDTENPELINRIAWGIVEQVQGGDDVEPEMVKAACEAAKRAVELAKKVGDDEQTAAILDTHANLLFICEKLDLSLIHISEPTRPY